MSYVHVHIVQTKIDLEERCWIPRWELNPQPWLTKAIALPTKPPGLSWQRLSYGAPNWVYNWYIHVNYMYMYLFLQVYAGDQWHKICKDSSFTLLSGDVLCKQLGYSAAVRILTASQWVDTLSIYYLFVLLWLYLPSQQFGGRKFQSNAY